MGAVPDEDEDFVILGESGISAGPAASSSSSVAMDDALCVAFAAQYKNNIEKVLHLAKHYLVESEVLLFAQGLGVDGVKFIRCNSDEDDVSEGAPLLRAKGNHW